MSSYCSPSKHDICVDPRTLSILLKSTTKLKEHGGRMEAEELWLRNYYVGSQSCLDSTQELDLSEDDMQIQILKDARKALCSLMESLDWAIAKGRDQIIPLGRRRDLVSLPKEVILRIFRNLMELEEDIFVGARKVIFIMSLVCKHLRDMVLSFTAVWTYLDLNACRGQALELLLLRGKNGPLSVQFNYSDDLEQDILQVLAHKDRWHYLSAEFDSMDNKLVEAHPSLVFPSIETLRLLISSIEHHGYPDWSFPCAKVVELVDDLPPGDYLKSLQSFKYVSNSCEFGEGGGFLKRLVEILKHAPLLHTIYLDVSLIIFPTYSDSLNAFEVELPNVVSFSISNWIRDESYMSGEAEVAVACHPPELAQITRALRMPKVQNVSISIAFEEEFDLAKWFIQAFPDPYQLCSVSNLSFSIRTQDEDAPTLTLPISTFFTRSPLLQTLSLNTENCKVSFTHDDLQNNPLFLRTLRIGNCANSPNELYKLLRTLVANHADLSELEIETEHVLSAHKLKNIVPYANIHVSAPKSAP